MYNSLAMADPELRHTPSPVPTSASYNSFSTPNLTVNVHASPRSSTDSVDHIDFPSPHVGMLPTTQSLRSNVDMVADYVGRSYQAHPQSSAGSAAGGGSAAGDGGRYTMEPPPYNPVPTPTAFTFDATPYSYSEMGLPTIPEGAPSCAIYSDNPDYARMYTTGTFRNEAVAHHHQSALSSPGSVTELLSPLAAIPLSSPQHRATTGASRFTSPAPSNSSVELSASSPSTTTSPWNGYSAAPTPTASSVGSGSMGDWSAAFGKLEQFKMSVPSLIASASSSSSSGAAAAAAAASGSSSSSSSPKVINRPHALTYAGLHTTSQRDADDDDDHDEHDDDEAEEGADSALEEGAEASPRKRPKTPAAGATPVTTGFRRQDSGFRCEYPGCEAVVGTHFSLKRHMKRHTGARPFICTWPKCEKAFAEKSTLKRHLKVHMPVPDMVACYTCEVQFPDSPSLQRHANALHRRHSPPPHPRSSDKNSS